MLKYFRGTNFDTTGKTLIRPGGQFESCRVRPCYRQHLWYGGLGSVLLPLSDLYCVRYDTMMSTVSQSPKPECIPLFFKVILFCCSLLKIQQSPSFKKKLKLKHSIFRGPIAVYKNGSLFKGAVGSTI